MHPETDTIYNIKLLIIKCPLLAASIMKEMLQNAAFGGS